uniref:Uncharacterized protein n=1 Tax=Knipowitschia caucasica TaxID=637954 RepID=A0AAV2JUI9_KNICA
MATRNESRVKNEDKRSRRGSDNRPLLVGLTQHPEHILSPTVSHDTHPSAAPTGSPQSRRRQKRLMKRTDAKQKRSGRETEAMNTRVHTSAERRP